jgi:pentatricopeptide repeat protein
MTKTSQKELIFLLLLFLFALGLRLIYLGQLQGSPMFDAPIMDAKYHDEWAQSIGQDWLQSTKPFHEGPYFRAPLYGYFLALLYTLTDHSYLIPRIIQFLMGAVSVLLIYFLSKRTFGAQVGRVAAVLAAMYGTFIYFEGELLIPALILFLNLLLMLAVLSTAERPGWWRWLGCGALLGLSAIARPNVLVFLGVLVPWMLVRLRRDGVSLRRSLFYVVAVLLGALLVISPVTARNWMVGKDFVPIASQGGVNFFIGNNRDSDGSTAIVPGTRATWWGGYYDAVQLAEEAAGRSLKASEVSNYWFKRGLEFMRDEPATALRLMAKKLALFWGGAEIANNKDIYFFTERRPLLNLLLWPGIVFCPFGIVAPLALAGMVLAWRRREGTGGLLALFVFGYMASVVLFFVTARFRLPVIPFLLPFAAYCLVSLYRERRFSRWAFALVFIVVFGVMVNMNLAGTPLPSRAESHNSLGGVYLAKQMHPEALEEFGRALDIDPNYVRSIAGLARTYIAMDSTDKARQQWERAISVSPDMAELHFHVGFSYYAQGRVDDAIASWKEAARLQPELPQPYFQMGIAHEDKGEYQEAQAAYEQAMSVNPQYVLANYNLGHLYKKMGRIDDAVEQFRQAIETNPNFGDAYNSLAWLYAQEGTNLDEGVELINKALEMDESRGAYWDTLAELYIRKGQLEEAREIFRRMIKREPQNPFWGERLGEVGG